jgi:hypothetical protein
MLIRARVVLRGSHTDGKCQGTVHRQREPLHRGRSAREIRDTEMTPAANRKTSPGFAGWLVLV